MPFMRREVGPSVIRSNAVKRVVAAVAVAVTVAFVLFIP